MRRSAPPDVLITQMKCRCGIATDAAPLPTTARHLIDVPPGGRADHQRFHGLVDPEKKPSPSRKRTFTRPLHGHRAGYRPAAGACVWMDVQLVHLPGRPSNAGNPDDTPRRCRRLSRAPNPAR